MISLSSSHLLQPLGRVTVDYLLLDRLPLVSVVSCHCFCCIHSTFFWEQHLNFPLGNHPSLILSPCSLDPFLTPEIDVDLSKHQSITTYCPRDQLRNGHIMGATPIRVRKIQIPSLELSWGELLFLLDKIEWSSWQLFLSPWGETSWANIGKQNKMKRVRTSKKSLWDPQCIWAWSTLDLLYESKYSLKKKIKPIWIEFPIIWKKRKRKKESQLIMVIVICSISVSLLHSFSFTGFLFSSYLICVILMLIGIFTCRILDSSQPTPTEPSPVFTHSSLLNTTNSVAPILISIEWPKFSPPITTSPPNPHPPFF